MIRFVYFDVGGVVIRDFSGTSKWQEMKKDLGITSKQGKDFDQFFEKYEKEVCVGRDVETLVPMMEEKFGLKFSNGYSFLRDFVDRYERNEPIWPIVKKAKVEYKIGLLTNMYPGMLGSIKKRGLMPKVEWDAEIDSSLAGFKKPDERICRLAQKKAGVEGEEILFVENSKRHLKVPRKLGWQTFWYDSSKIEVSNLRLAKRLGLFID
jgi:FMN phosphatase YigB (HAD superfamily)